MSSIFSQAELQSFIGKSLTDALARQVTKAVNAYVERVTKRCWGDTVTVTESYGYKRHIWLRHQDVRHVSSVSFAYPIGNTKIEVGSGAYYCSDLGRLSFACARGPVYADVPAAVEVTYTYGVDDVPEDLKLAALGIAAGFYNWASGGQKEVSATQVGSYRVEYTGNRRASDSIDTAAQANFTTVSSYATRRG